MLNFTQCTLLPVLSNQVTWLCLTLHSVNSSSCQVTWLYLTLHSVKSSSCQIKWLDYTWLYTACTVLPQCKSRQVKWPYYTWLYTVWTLLPVKSSDLTVLDFSQSAFFFLKASQDKSSDSTVLDFTQWAFFFLVSQVTWLYLTLHSVHSSSCQVKRLDCTWLYTVWTLLLVKSGDLTVLDFTQCALFFLAGHGPSFDKTKLGLCCGGLWRHCIRPGRLQRFTTCFSQGRDLSHSCHHGRPCWYIS